ncbi:MAG TPA: hypothetical protein VH394_01645 [Thermoanaerobaculia bacterium]|jgi:chromosome segregation ATPase|nr:hypothetical protein [Thermoanaerobaculia bacterium]
MRNATIRILLAGALLLLSTGTAGAQAAAGGTLEQEVINLDRSLQELVSLLREVLARQEVDLLFKRVELGLQKMGPLNQELADLRSRKAEDDAKLSQFRTAMAALQVPDTSPEASEEGEVRRMQLEAEIARLKRQTSESGQRIAELENALAEEQQDVERWEAEIDRRLGRR